jgi:hypothetical protein
MRTLDQAIAERVAEKQKRARLLAQEAEDRERQIRETETRATELFATLIERRYDLAPGSIQFRAKAAVDGTFSLSAHVGPSDDNDVAYIELLNPVAIGPDETVIIRNVGAADGSCWKACHGGYFYNYTDLIDAVLYARGGQ